MEKEKMKTLEDVMASYGFNKEDLLENAEFMGYNKDRSWDGLDEEQIRKRLASEVLANPKQVLSRLPMEDLQMLSILKDVDPGMAEKFQPIMRLLTMSSMGLADQKEDDGLELVFITEDFKQVIRPVLDEVINDFEVGIRFVVERYLVGALNIYGVLTLGELKAVLKECLDLEDDGSGLFDHIYPTSIVLQYQRVEGHEDVEEDLFVSPFVEDYGYILNEREKHNEIKALKPFGKDAVLEAGWMPLPTIPNPMGLKFRRTFEGQLGFTESEVHHWQLLLWRIIQEEDMPATEIVKMVIDAVESHKVFRGIEELNSVMRVVMDFLNNMPRWIFSGHSSEEVQRLVPHSSKAPRVVIGENMRRMGYKEEDVQQQVDALWNQKRGQDPEASNVSSTKVGRNDPCPCGSGKKYKHCCGK